MEKECQIGSMPISLFWGKKGNLFFAVQHFFGRIKRPSFITITATLGDWLCRTR